jgi:hypothetical protein
MTRRQIDSGALLGVGWILRGLEACVHATPIFGQITAIRPAPQVKLLEGTLVNKWVSRIVNTYAALMAELSW